MVNRYQMPQNWGNPRTPANQFPRPMYRPMMNQQMNPSYPSMQMRRFRQMGPMGPQGQMQTRGGGGLLAKLFGKTAPQMGGGMLGMGPSAVSGMAGKAASGGSILQSLTNPTAISGFLNNTQQILSAIQQISPLVSQYGPIVKNLPAMWRLYRGLKGDTSTNDEVEEDRTIEIEESSSLGEVEESSSSDDLESSNNASSKEMITTSSSSRDADGSRNSKSNDWNESEEIEESSSSDGLRERRSFPRMYI
ncbi:YqfQ family protein [Bacillus sp. DNRA2]|uniref:YqfQ family protein n=1 Tax=Bacillus sp. DNRA2 TaxID=2723053 RepID=UPI002006E432|nr:YqfQ family protein [Bacillus sp. DNRA2]